MSVSFRPWSLSMDLSGLESGGVRRLRTLIHFKDGSETEDRVFDFKVANDGADNRAPKISGNAPNSVSAGVAYNFQPTGSDADGDTLSFNITNRPSWASFDRSTGRVSGTPTVNDVGNYRNIVISVSDGQASGSLPAFSIRVEQFNIGSATLTWNPPTQRIDNTALTDLAGYEIHYGQSSRSYSNRIVVNNSGLTTYVVDNLSSGTWFFAITAFDSSGQNSGVSNEGQKVIP